MSVDVDTTFPGRSKVCGKWNFPRLFTLASRNRGVPRVVHIGAFAVDFIHNQPVVVALRLVVLLR
jgi:hypothetical protein